jgi:hypothetical protein
LLPVGYLLLGMVLLLVGLGCVATAAGADDIVIRAVSALVAMLSLVLVEALWWVRPWVARAVDAWAAVCVGAVLVPALVAGVTMGLAFFVVLSLAALVLVGLPCLAARWYVRDRAARLGLLPGRAP